MPKLIDSADLGGIPSARSGRTIASYDVTAPFQATAQAADTAAKQALIQGEAAAKFGDTLASAGAAISADWERVNALKTETQFQLFKTGEAQAYDTAARNIQPGDSQGFADSYAAGYKDRAKAFFASVPDNLKPTYDLKLLVLQQGIHADAQTAERAQQFQQALNTIHDTTSNALLPRIEIAAKLPEGSPEKVKQLQSIQEDGLKLIDANPALTPVEKDNEKRKLKEILQTSFAQALPASERLNVDPSQARQTIGERIVQVESGGDPTIGNPASTAVGAGQFVEGTWIGLLSKYRPDLVKGKSRAAVLELRNDPALSADMVNRYAAENGAYLGARGYGATPGNLYLAHFLEPQGAVALLAGSPDQSGASIAPAAAKSNPTVFYHSDATGKIDFNSPKTVAEIQQWSADKMAGTEHTDWSRTLDAVPYETKVSIAADAAGSVVRQQTAIAQQQKAVYSAQVNALQNAILDGTAGITEISQAYDNGNGWLTDATDRASLVKMVQERDKASVNLASATALVTGNQPLNQFDKPTQDAVDLFYEKGNLQGGAGLLQGDQPSIQGLRAVVERSGYVPKSAVSTLKAGIWSKDDATRAQAFTIIDGLMRENPAAVAQSDFKAEDLRRVDIYQQYGQFLPPAELAKELDPNMDPQAKKSLDALEEQGRQIASKIDPAEITATFDKSGWFSSGLGAPIDALTNDALHRDWIAAYSVAYSRVGANDAKARELATTWLTREKWGQTDIGSGSFIMQYPPERKFLTIDGRHDWMDTQVDDAVSKAYPGAISWAPVTVPATVRAISLGQPPPYAIGVIDKDGNPALIMPPVDANGQAKPGWPFDYEKAHEVSVKRFDEMRRRALDPRFRTSTGNKGGAPYIPPLPGDQPASSPPSPSDGSWPPDPSYGHVR